MTILESQSTPLDVAASITIGSQSFDATSQLSVGDSWTSKPLSAGTCFDVTLESGGSNQRYRYRIDW